MGDRNPAPHRSFPFVLFVSFVVQKATGASQPRRKEPDRLHHIKHHKPRPAVFPLRGFVALFPIRVLQTNQWMEKAAKPQSREEEDLKAR